MNCKDCYVQRQMLIEEGLHLEECVEDFTKCCRIASQLLCCNFQSKPGRRETVRRSTLATRRTRSHLGQHFSNVVNDLPTVNRLHFPGSWLREVVTIR